MRWTFGSVITAVHGVDWSARYQQGPLTEQVELDGPTVERFLQEGRRYFEGAVRELDESLMNKTKARMIPNLSTVGSLALSVVGGRLSVGTTSAMVGTVTSLVVVAKW